MDSDENKEKTESYIEKIIQDQVKKIEDELSIKIDQKIINHMKNEWSNSKFNMSLYAMNKIIEEMNAKLVILKGRVDLCEELSNRETLD